MRLLLINPRLDFSSCNPRLDHFLKTRYDRILRDISLGLLTVAALSPPDVEVTYLDENFDKPGPFPEADIVGIHAMTPQAPRAYEIAAIYRRRKTAVILGGPHPSVLPDEATSHADAVVAGEAEQVWARCLSDARQNKLKPIYQAPLADLSRSRSPRYDLMGDRHSFLAGHHFVPVQFSRGCPRGCAYCSVTLLSGRRTRSKTSCRITREIDGLAALFPREQLVLKVVDANPFVDLARARTRIRALAHAGVRWTSFADASICKHPEMLSLLRRSGCTTLNVGFENLDADALDLMSPWKGRHLTSYPDIVRAIQDHGLVATGNFMLGWKPHTQDTVRRIRDFVIEQNVFSHYFVVTPYPGTQFYAELKRRRKLRPDVGWDRYNAFNMVYRGAMTEEQVTDDVAWLYEQTWAPEVIEKINRANIEIWNRGEAQNREKPKGKASAP